MPDWFPYVLSVCGAVAVLVGFANWSRILWKARDPEKVKRAEAMTRSVMKGDR